MCCCRKTDELEASSVDFIGPHGVIAAGLGHRVALDLLKLTSTTPWDAGQAQEEADSPYHHASWRAGCLTEQQGSALRKGLATILQSALPGVVYKADQDAHKQLRQQYPEVGCSMQTKDKLSFLCCCCASLCCWPLQCMLNLHHLRDDTKRRRNIYMPAAPLPCFTEPMNATRAMHMLLSAVLLSPWNLMPENSCRHLCHAASPHSCTRCASCAPQLAAV